VADYRHADEGSERVGDTDDDVGSEAGEAEGEGDRCYHEQLKDGEGQRQRGPWSRPLALP
jgi:hypothetical protein